MLKERPTLVYGHNLAFLTAIIYPKRIARVAIIIKPSMLIKFHAKTTKEPSSMSDKYTGRRGFNDSSMDLSLFMRHWCKGLCVFIKQQ